jgi:hypothetical protein
MKNAPKETSDQIAADHFGLNAVIRPMGIAPNHEAQAQSFLKHYYTTCVSNPANLYTFYATDASVCRDGQISLVPVTADSSLALPVPPGASINVHNLISAALDSALHITVAGAVAAPGGPPRGFSQNFVLADVHGMPSIALDVFGFIDDPFYKAARPGVSFSVPELREPRAEANPPLPARSVVGPVQSVFT